MGFGKSVAYVICKWPLSLQLSLVLITIKRGKTNNVKEQRRDNDKSEKTGTKD